MNIHKILAVTALICAVLAFVVPGYPLLTAAVILLAISHLV
jgi:hypothetical protein